MKVAQCVDLTEESNVHGQTESNYCHQLGFAINIEQIAIRRLSTTLRRIYDRDLKTVGTSLRPKWEDVIAAASMWDEWRGFVDALCTADGSGGTKV